MKPEVSLAATGSLPSEAANANARLKVCSDVVMVRTTSTSAISGTGLKKCSPTKRSARFVAPAIPAIVRLDVFEAKIVPAAHKPSSSWKSAFLSARSSMMASITMSTLRRSATTVVNVSRLSAASRSAGWSFPFSTSLASDFSMPARPRSNTVPNGPRGALFAPRKGARTLPPPRGQPAPRHEHQPRRRGEGGRDECARAGPPPPHNRHDGGAGDAFGALLPDVRLESDETKSRLELHDLRGHLAGLCERVAPSSRQRALNRRECARFGLPRRAVGEMSFGLQQLFLYHPPTQLALDRRAIAGNDSVRHNRAGTGEPRPRPGRHLGGNARLLLEHCLAQIAVRNADVFPERQDLVVRETVANVVFPGLQLGGALDDALQRLTTDEVSASCLTHQTLALPLFRGAGRRSRAVRSGSARLPESLACGAKRSMNPLNRSIGIGKIVVELFSDAISLTVCRYRS